MTTNTITARQASDWIASGEAVLIDVREPDEFRGEHIAAALSLPLAEVGNMAKVMSVPEGKKLSPSA
ncbi:rhodanese-like domain-containing protein [Rhizobium sp. 18055]|uniref:rhodanese-like domain-containing protein n=1 Tax=Rhizobium sp. 18055 TaxID=2681403 RepID=UPI001FCF17E6|nr:rhodanese-like domain-containing protein [Rhizobium sp. 18055]